MVEIRLTNTKTRGKEVFAPIDPQNVRLYLCGPTVYDRAHLGNARPVIVIDVLVIALQFGVMEQARLTSNMETIGNWCTPSGCSTRPARKAPS